MLLLFSNPLVSLPLHDNLVPSLESFASSSDLLYRILMAPTICFNAWCTLFSSLKNSDSSRSDLCSIAFSPKRHPFLFPHYLRLLTRFQDHTQILYISVCDLPLMHEYWQSENGVLSMIVHTFHASFKAKLLSASSTGKWLLATFSKGFAVHAPSTRRYRFAIYGSCLASKPLNTLVLLLSYWTTSWDRMHLIVGGFAFRWFPRHLLMHSSRIAWYLARSSSFCSSTMLAFLFFAMLLRV